MSVGVKAHKRSHQRQPRTPERVREWHPMRPHRSLKDPVPNWRLRKWYLRNAMWGEINLARVAEDVGWLRRDNGSFKGDESRVRRALGVSKQSPSVKKGRVYPGNARRWIEREDAVRLAEAMGADPVDVGL